MFCVSSFPPHDSRTTLYNTLILFSSPFTFRLLVILNVFFRLDSVSAAPAITAHSHLYQRDDQSVNSSSSFRIWVPILIVVVVLAIIALYVCSIRANNGGLPRALANFSRAAAIGNGTMMPTTTELTADQLTGNASTTTANDTSNNATNNRTRRPRRTRRTPSQISTTSLPVYMKEPGEQELVIIRGPQDMEDVPLDTEMPPVREDGEHERYTPMPDSPQHMPLLDDEGAVADESAAALLPDAHEQPRSRPDETGGRDSAGSAHSGDSSSLVRVDTNVTTETPDPRGDAPAYYEVVDLNDESQQSSAPSSSMPTQTNSSMTAGSSTASRGTASRRSLRNLFSWTGHRNPVAPPGLPATTSSQLHARADSGGALSLTSTMSRPSTSNRQSHRPSQSSSSAFSVMNPLNRKKSTVTLSSNHLTSPSSISLASISAPLTHTAVRTEFTYPKAGPTPDQLKLISSREAFARFGVPYGEDAIAFAASTHDLNPPPEFESAAGPSSSSSPRPRSQSHAGVMARQSIGRSSESSGSSVLEPPEIRVQRSSRPVSPSVEGDMSAPAVDPPSSTQNGITASAVVDASEPSGEVASHPQTAETSETQSAEVQNSPKDDVTSPSDVQAPSSPLASVAPAQHGTSIPTSSSKPPPTSFRNPPQPGTVSTPSLRSESRASSFRSFATAQESVNEFGVVSGGSGSGSGTPTMSEYFSEQETEIGDGDSRPATPTTSTRQMSQTILQPTLSVDSLGSVSRHVLEGTDTTIRAAA
ncbi:hypothetical protein F5880DRAFT_434757 [Lentinula raphanica]|nr:hypothetical protein F5880DRAFT_434757 [Lentinula raphanica]